MYSDVQRGPAYRERLMDFIRQTYPLSPTSISPAKRGFYGETWRLDALSGPCFLKLDYSAHQAVYARSFPVLEHLHRHGIDFVSRIVKAKNGDLFARFDGAVLGLFDWIDGENIETDATKIPEYRMLARVYAVPDDGLDIPREDFGTASAEQFYRRWDGLKAAPRSAEADRALALFEAHQALLWQRRDRLSLFSARCAGDLSGMHITHGDPGGNLIVQGETYRSIDWDDPRIAPPERDAWFMCGHDWAQAAFEEALREQGIEYALRRERLAYYCYHSFFSYLNEHLDCLEERGASEGLQGYFESWVERPIGWAEHIV